MDKRDLPLWFMILIAFMIISVCMFGFIMTQGKTDIDGAYQFVSYAFLVLALGTGVYTIGIAIDDFKIRKMKKSSYYRSSFYRDFLNYRVGKGRSRW